MKKLFAVLAVLALLFGTVPPASATLIHTNADLSGFYVWQMQGTSNGYGYSSCSATITDSDCTWTPVVGGVCPADQTCSLTTFTKILWGTLEFDGDGHITSGTYSFYDPAKTPAKQSGTVTG